MSPQKIDNVLSWASDIDKETLEQAAKTSRLPFVHSHLALMPDAHYGIGATVGSVIATEGAIIPAAVGVDIGCGMAAVQTSLFAKDLPDSLESFQTDLEYLVPAGVGIGHAKTSVAAESWFRKNCDNFRIELTTKLSKKTLEQYGTLGSGNHFFEVCLDESQSCWIVLHSGSRGLGNTVGHQYIKDAKKIMQLMHIRLEDPDLAYFVETQQEFLNYINDMLICQDYALQNRAQMLHKAVVAFFDFVGNGKELQTINCHHNFTQKEHFNSKNLWITRKGAIKAAVGDFGIIPGSMGTKSYIVSGLGNASSYNSCSHGAGRRLSRTKAKAEFTVDDLNDQMSSVATWQTSKAKHLIDEIPAAYKDIETVMRDQQDLVKIEHELKQILNYKGT